MDHIITVKLRDDNSKLIYKVHINIKAFNQHTTTRHTCPATGGCPATFKYFDVGR